METILLTYLLTDVSDNWLRLTTLIGGRCDRSERFIRRLRLASRSRRRRRHLAEAVGRQRANVAVIADDRDADRSG